MMKYLKVNRVATAFLALWLAASLAACGPNDSDGTDTVAETAAGTTADTIADTAAGTATDTTAATDADSASETVADSTAVTGTPTETTTATAVQPDLDTDPATEPTTDPVGESETFPETASQTVPETLGETAVITLGDPETNDPNTPPPVDYDPPETLIGDGVETTGLYPTFSHKGGLYLETELSVEITAPEGYSIRYTTNGSMPTGSAKKYSAAIKLSHADGEATVIRAACFDANNKLCGQVITHTYVTVASTESLTYTVMLTTDQSNLNDMYADYKEKIEHAAHAEIIAPDGTRIISQDVGLRLFGGSSRSLSQKSFKIIARKDGYFANTPYAGAGTFTYPFFPERIVQAGKNAGQVLTKYDGLILRNGGNDSLHSSAADPLYPSLLRDGIANEFMHKYAPHVGASLSHFAAVYVNGEYYGVLELRENQNEDYVKRIWGVLDDDVVVVKSELDTNRHCDGTNCQGSGCRFCGVWFYYETDENAAAQAEMAAWIALARKAAGAVDADEQTYRQIFEEVSAKVDLQNVKEYLAISCFLCNSDWPYNNVRLWRYTGAVMDGVEITDGKWRFATRDMDMTMGRYTGNHMLPDINTKYDRNMFAWVLSNYVDGYDSIWEGQIGRYEDALYLQGLFAFLLRDDTFRGEFAEYCRLIASDEAKADLLALYENAFDQVKPLMKAHIARWKGQGIPADLDYRQWSQKTCPVIEDFIKKRPAVFIEQLEELLAKYK